MNLKYLSRQELDLQMRNLAKKEREVLHEVLLTVKEIDSRKLYLEMGYSNLFAYLTEAIGYSAGSAQRRIDAARLIREIPEVAAKIETGEINLQHISLVQKAAREVFKRSANNVTTSEKKELIDSLCGTDARQAQVARYFDLPIEGATKIQTQADDSVRIELTLSKELYEKIQQAQSLLSHALGNTDLDTYLEYLTDKVIKQKTSISTAIRKLNQTKNQVDENDSGKVQAHSFSARQRKLVFQYSNCCQYVDMKSGKQCGSKWNLQVDHIQPRWADGDTALKNAQVLCGAHNRMRYSKQNNIRAIS